jgi:hypothetical protein
MKATLEFDMPDEEEAYSKSKHGPDWADVVMRTYELFIKMRSDRDQLEGTDYALEQIMEFIEAEMGIRNLSFED